MSSAERGLIFSEDPQRDVGENQLRAWVLFWDELVATKSPSQWDTLPRSASLLQSEGILSRQPVGTSRHDAILSKKADPALVAFQDLELLSPGKWSIALPTERRFIYSNTGRSILVHLYDALPVPTKDVPMEDVLTFRHRRRSELLATRYHLELIYQRVIQSGDGPLSLRSEFAALASAAADAVTVLEETRMPFHFAGVEAKLIWSFDLTPAALGAAIGALTSLPGALAGAGVGLLSNLIPKVEISTAGGLALTRDDPAVPFAYIVHMAGEL